LKVSGELTEMNTEDSKIRQGLVVTVSHGMIKAHISIKILQIKNLIRVWNPTIAEIQMARKTSGATQLTQQKDGSTVSLSMNLLKTSSHKRDQ
jgi:hypothetical protein